MNKTAIVVIVVLVLAVVGFFFYKMNNSEPIQNPAMSDGTSAPVETTNPAGKKMAFGDFVKQGGSYECSVNQSISGTDTSGTVYVDGGKVRGDFEVQSSAMGAAGSPIRIVMTFIVRDGYSYSWSSMMPNTGYKIAVSGGATGDASASASGSYSFDYDQVGDYDCKTWTADQSKFSLPTSVKFTEVKS